MGTTTEGLIVQVSSYPDLVLIALLFGMFMLYGLFRGIKSVSELALALPIAAFIYTLFPYELGWGEPALFGLITIASAWVLDRDTSGLDDGRDFAKVILASLGGVFLLLVISVDIIDFSSLYTFGVQVSNILTDVTYKFYIAAAGLVAVALSRKV